MKLWNGTSWTELNDLNTARHSMSSSGTTTSALAIWWRRYLSAAYGYNRRMEWIILD